MAEPCRKRVEPCEGAEIVASLAEQRAWDILASLAADPLTCTCGESTSRQGLSLEALSELWERCEPARFDIIATLSSIERALVDAVAERDARLGIDPLGEVSRLMGPLWGL